MSTATPTRHRPGRTRGTTHPFVGAGTMARSILRRNRLWLAVWLLALAALPLLTVPSLESLYPTQAALESYARTAGSSPAAIAMNGPGHAVHTLGGVAVFEVGGYLLIAVILMNIFTVGRNTRAEEEIGRLELVRASVVGRHAPLAGCLLVAVAANLVLGGIVGAGMVLLDLPASGATVFAASLAAIGIAFAAITAVTAQLAEYTRGAYALAGGVLGASYLVRAAGDVGDGTLSWFSPIGWAQATRPFADERWWPLALVIGLAVVLMIAAVVIEARRDHGAGVVRPRPGAAVASRWLRSQLGFALRLQRGSLLGWSFGVFLGGLAFGSVARETQDMMADNPELREIFDASGQRDLTDLFFDLTLLILALAIAGYVVSAVLRLRVEETAGYAESLLAGTLSRPRWLISRLVVPAAATVALLTLGGVGAGLAHALRSGELEQVPRVLGAALTHVPAVWLLASIGVLLFGVAPRVVAVTWAVFAGCVVASLLGNVFQLPDWAIDLSPFAHTPQLPGGDVTAVPLLVMTVVAVTLTALGVVGFRRRDLNSSR